MQLRLGLLDEPVGYGNPTYICHQNGISTRFRVRRLSMDAVLIHLAFSG
jgi:hypothetical protein